MRLHAARQCACTLLVALGAAYISYRHGRIFALRFGADPATAALWPLIVDGLVNYRNHRTVEVAAPDHRSMESVALLQPRYRVVAVCQHRISTPPQRVLGNRAAT